MGAIPGLLRYGLFLLLIFIAEMAVAQTVLTGLVTDNRTGALLPSVNIGARHTATGTISLQDGSFSILIPTSHESDTLTFSIIGYSTMSLPIQDLQPTVPNTIRLSPQTTQLKEVSITGQRLTEKKFGLKPLQTLFAFTEYQDPNDTVELAQLIKLGSSTAKITAISLYTEGSISDTVTVRVHFYAFDGKRPTHTLIGQDIEKTCTIKPGWLTIDLSEYNIHLEGNVIASLEYIPSADRKNNQVYYNVKIGGFSKTFIRNGWADNLHTGRPGEWKVPPAHYFMVLTALVPKEKKSSREENKDEAETLPSLRMFSQAVHDSFSVFVKLPARYSRRKKYAVAYLLDANVYFDQVGSSIRQLSKEKLLPETILVGIGYRDFKTGDSLRDRDYTSLPALPSDSFTVSGGADKFLTFIEQELVPYIDKSHRTDTSSRTLMGHSLGGLFTLNVLYMSLQEKNTVFKNFIAASPALHYHNSSILEQFRLLKDPDTGPRRLYLTMGSKETEEMPCYQMLSRELTEKKFEQLQSKPEIYPDYSHMETAINSFEKGLRFVLADPRQ